MDKKTGIVIACLLIGAAVAAWLNFGSGASNEVESGLTDEQLNRMEENHSIIQQMEEERRQQMVDVAPPPPPTPN